MRPCTTLQPDIPANESEPQGPVRSDPTRMPGPGVETGWGEQSAALFKRLPGLASSRRAHPV